MPSGWINEPERILDQLPIPLLRTASRLTNCDTAATWAGWNLRTEAPLLNTNTIAEDKLRAWKSLLLGHLPVSRRSGPESGEDIPGPCVHTQGVAQKVSQTKFEPREVATPL